MPKRNALQPIDRPANEGKPTRDRNMQNSNLDSRGSRTLLAVFLCLDLIFMAWFALGSAGPAASAGQYLDSAHKALVAVLPGFGGPFNGTGKL